MKKLLTALLLFPSLAWGQGSGTVSEFAIPYGLGPGFVGWGQVTPGVAGTVLQSNGLSAAPSFEAAGSVELDSICSVQGSIVYRNASAWVCLGPGTTGQTLQSQGAAANPIWSAAGSGDVISSSSGATTDKAVTRWDGTGGDTIQNSSVTLSDAGNFVGGTYSGLTITTTTGTLTITNAKTAAISNSITFAGTDGTTMTFPNATATIPRMVAAGAKALATSAITTGTCTSAQTDTATGVLTTDAIIASFNGDPVAVVGYEPVTTGRLAIAVYPTVDTVNFKVCNNTAGDITPGAITVNWRVIR